MTVVASFGTGRRGERNGDAIEKHDPRQVLPGDMVFFSMKKSGSARVDHVGIYVGKGLFVHASVSRGVHIESISKAYYEDRMIRVLKYPGF